MSVSYTKDNIKRLEDHGKVVNKLGLLDWESLVQGRSLNDIVDDIYHGLANQRNRPSREAIEYLCVLNNIRREGNKAAHTATKQEIAHAYGEWKEQKEKDFLAELSLLQFGEEIGNIHQPFSLLVCGMSLGDGVPAANIVDCDLLEAAKENVQPLAMGRRVTTLSEILATPHAHRESKISATRNKLRINVELALEDEKEGDPLDAYCRLVYWTVENYPQGHSAESGLLELLEEATRVLKDVKGGTFRGDLKYLKLWLLYGSFVEKPTIIYKFLIANEIGTQHALLYEEHAAVLERDGRKREADDAYALGVARKAEPLDHLKSRYDEFQKRMMSNISLPAAPLPVPRPARQALALASSPTTSSQTSRVSSSRTVPASASTSQAPQTNSRLQIFVDPTGEEAQSAAAPLGGTNEWNELGTRKMRIKENAPDVKKMAGSTIKQPGKSKRLAAVANGNATGSSSKIMVFRDPAPEDIPPTPVPASSAQKSSGSGSRVSSSKGMTPFVDGQHEETAAVGPHSPGGPAATFIPFRDESVPSSQAAVTAVGNSIMKIKKGNEKAPEPTSEAEALRKDPLKNYSQGSLGNSLHE